MRSYKVAKKKHIFYSFVHLYLTHGALTQCLIGTAWVDSRLWLRKRGSKEKMAGRTAIEHLSYWSSCAEDQTAPRFCKPCILLLSFRLFRAKRKIQEKFKFLGFYFRQRWLSNNRRVLRGNLILDLNLLRLWSKKTLKAGVYWKFRALIGSTIFKNIYHLYQHLSSIYHR